VDEGDKALVLSKSRSEAVARYLTAYHSISLTRILMRSRGAKNPAVSNDDPRQRFKNRRVVITVR
jgi:outer membrane protein OmpA-like peptidoglycan-associated protein